MCRLLSVLSFVLVLAVPAFPQGRGKGKGHRSESESAVSARFQPQEVQIILGYYGPGGGGLPPGLAKRGGNLPPGLEKQLRRNGQLPPGLQKKVAPFPPVLEQRLPPVCRGCRRVVVDTWALLIQDATNVVLDIVDLSRGRR